MHDRCKNNQVTDVATVNMPEGYDRDRINERGARLPDAACTTFVYAAYLPPGLHQFIIYCPVTRRAFCKDVVIDLSASDFYPEFPRQLKEPVGEEPPPKLTRINVWRQWRVDSEEDDDKAFQNDVAPAESFEPELFLKDPADVEECKKILFENFAYIKIAYVEGLAGSPASYPEVGSWKFITAILDCQETDEEKARLSRAQIETSYIRATKGDKA